MLDALWHGAARLLIVTDGGPRALRWYTRRRRGQLATFAGGTRSTANAAGDAFVGGLLFQLARRGVAAASLCEFAADDAALLPSIALRRSLRGVLP